MGKKNPDLVLIDGRYRVASILYSFLKMKTRIVPIYLMITSIGHFTILLINILMLLRPVITQLF